MKNNKAVTKMPPKDNSKRTKNRKSLSWRAKKKEQKPVQDDTIRKEYKEQPCAAWRRKHNRFKTAPIDFDKIEANMMKEKIVGMEGFNYIVNPPVIPKVVFGTSMDRTCLPLEGPGLTSFMRRHAAEVRAYPGPCENYKELQFGKPFPSIRGFSRFADQTKRPPDVKRQDFPPIGAYDIEPPRSTQQAAKPFNIGVDYRADPSYLTPGPPTYPYNLPKRQPKLDMAFGKRRIIWPEVSILCSTFNAALCMVCNLQPVGDYFHNWKKNQNLCRACMHKKRDALKVCKVDPIARYRGNLALDDFIPCRYCLFYHNHMGTRAAMSVMTKKELRKKIVKENYLYKYNL